MARIFVSCGQHSAAERKAANAIRSRLRRLGFDVYVAVSVQSIEDVNSGILRQLKLSDYYVFIDFAREKIEDKARGSLFTHQELAIAYLLGFERVLFFQQAGLRLEGLLRYMGSNATIFEQPTDLPTLIVNAFRDREWRPDYSRHLSLVRLRWCDPYPGEGFGKFLCTDIENRRHDAAAFQTAVRLLRIETNKGISPSPVRSQLRVTGSSVFEQTIWPRDHGAFDLLVIDCMDKTRVCIDSTLDISFAPTLFHGVGKYALHYAVIARDFPIHQFTVELNVTGKIATTNFKVRRAENAG